MQAAIIGCGSIGTYLGATLILGGFSDTVLVGRPRLLAEIEQQGGLRISDFEKNQLFLPRERIQFRTLIGDLSDRSALIFTCKLVSLEAIAKEIRVTGQLSPSASLFVLTNGLAGEEILRRVFPEHFICVCMAGFSVNWFPPAHFCLGTSLPLVFEKDSNIKRAGERELFNALKSSGVNVSSVDDIKPVQRGKLLINLNNPLNALFCQPITAQVSEPLIREVWASMIDEGLQVFAAHNFPVAPVGALNMKWMPAILRLPNWLFRIVARSMLRLDQRMISSMQADIRAGRATEIDFLCGEIIQMANTIRPAVTTTVNSRITELMHTMEQNHMRPYSAEEIHYVVFGTRTMPFWKSIFPRWNLSGTLSIFVLFFLFCSLVYAFAFLFIHIFFK